MGCVGFLGAMLMTSEPGNEEAIPMDHESELIQWLSSKAGTQIVERNQTQGMMSTHLPIQSNHGKHINSQKKYLDKINLIVLKN